MKTILCSISLLLLGCLPVMSQNGAMEYHTPPNFKKSVFYSLCDNLHFEGTANWQLEVELEEQLHQFISSSTIPAVLDVTKYEEGVYDCSEKRYRLFGEQLQLEYAISNEADALCLQVLGRKYALSGLDGGFDVHLKYLAHQFRTTEESEVMEVVVIHDFQLTTLDDPFQVLTLKKGSRFVVKTFR